MPANNSTTESGGFTAEERAAMKARAATGNDVHRQRLEEDVSGRCSGGCLCQLTGVIVGSKRRSPERRQAQEATPANWRRDALEPCRATRGLSERSTLRMVSRVERSLKRRARLAGDGPITAGARTWWHEGALGSLGTSAGRRPGMGREGRRKEQPWPAAILHQIS